MTNEIDKPTLVRDCDTAFGRVQTRMMFKQFNPKGTECLEDWRKRFVGTLDITEYSGAIELLGSWETWKQFKKNWPSFQKLYLNSWLEEIEIVIRSQALRSLINNATLKGDTSAAKFMVEAKYQEKQAGRPSKEKVDRELRIQTQIEKEIAEDLSRVHNNN